MGDSTETDNAPRDLQVRRLAREMEAEIGGLFGIDHRDIERAIERARSGAASEAPPLPTPVEKTLRLLDLLHDLAREVSEAGDAETLGYMRELLDNYRDRIARL